MTSPTPPAARTVFTSAEAFLASLSPADKRRIQRAVAEAMGLDIGTGFGGPVAGQLHADQVDDAARAAAETPAGPESSGRRGSQARRAHGDQTRARRATTTSEVT